MKPRIVIPVRGLAHGKSRLAPVLSPVEREALVRTMLDHVQGVARQVAPTFVLSGDPSVLALADHPWMERALGLNPALERVAREFDQSEPLMVLHADLPLLTAADLHAMLALLGEADAVAAPDRTGTGTNALLLARPGLISYEFGNDSLPAYCEAAKRNGLQLALCRRPGLAFDLDLPADLRLLAQVRSIGQHRSLPYPLKGASKANLDVAGPVDGMA